MFYLPVRTYHQTDSEDVMVKYAPNGNSKFGLIGPGAETGHAHSYRGPMAH
jgi:alkaline phosphatase D